MPLQRCMAEHTSREFVDWLEWLDEKEKETTKEEFYLARIAMEVYNSKATKNAMLKPLSWFLLKFTRGKASVSNEDPEAKMAKSKGFWGMFLKEK